MNRFNKCVGLFLLLFCLGQSGHIHASAFQETSPGDTIVPIQTVVERTQLYLDHYPIEKVHLHFDKPYYSVGDTVWFKGYLTNNLVQYAPSEIMYVEVMNSRDSLMQTLKMPLVGQTGKGQLVLDPQWFGRDNYRIRAYTKWMANFESEYFFNKIIPVGDVINSKLQTTIAFQDESNDRAARSVAVLQFQDATGNVLANRRVNWEVISNFQSLDRGRIDTDAMGNARITLTANDREAWENGRLFLSVQDSRGSTPLVADYALKSAFFDADVQFFPEGGDLLEGVAKKVAFKVVGTDGKGLDVKGEILDNDDQVVTTFESLHAGMGYFAIYPLEGKSYRARVAFENGRTKEVDLPPTVKQGMNLIFHARDSNHVQLALVTNESYLQQNMGNSYYLMATSNGFLVYGAQATLKAESMLINIPLERLPTGLMQVAVMTDKGVPVSERTIFVENLAPLHIDIALNKTEFVPKEKVELEMAVTNNDSTFIGVYSMAVVDESKVPYDENDEITILSNFLLTSDLKGYVERPNYYFNRENENRIQALDALMMTQAYKRFSYNNMISGIYPEVVFLPEQGIEISGILRMNDGKPVANGGLLLSIPDRSFRTDVYTDEYGRFSFKGLVFTDSSRVTINARGNDNYRNMVIYVDQTNYPLVDENQHWADGILNIEVAMKPYLNHSRNIYRTEHLIEEVVVTAPTRATRNHREYSSLTGLSMADHQISPERLAGCTNLLMCFQTVLTGITYDTQTRLFYITRDYNAGGRIPVQFFMNGMPIDVVSINAINPADVEGVDIFLKDELGTVSRIHQNNGVVSIYTKEQAAPAPRMSLAEIERMLPKSNVIDLTPLGYLKEYTFYVPKYDTPDSQAVKDIRSTVYWNPGIETGDDGKFKVEFYNGDDRGPYRIVVEGMDATGNFGRAVYRYHVR